MFYITRVFVCFIFILGFPHGHRHYKRCQCMKSSQPRETQMRHKKGIFCSEYVRKECKNGVLTLSEDCYFLYSFDFAFFFCFSFWIFALCASPIKFEVWLYGNHFDVILFIEAKQVIS